jgi:hypothetical protein
VYPLLLRVWLVLVLLKRIGKHLKKPALKSPRSPMHVVAVHNAHRPDFDPKNTLMKENMTDSVVNEITGRLTRMNHELVSKLRQLGTSSVETTPCPLAPDSMTNRSTP